MKLLIGSNQWEIDTQNITPDDLFRMIEGKLIEDQLFLKQIVIDGEPVDDFENRIISNMLTISDISIETVTHEQVTFDTIGSATKYLDQSLPLIPKLAAGFHQGIEKSDWKSLSDFFEGIEWLKNMLEVLVYMDSQYIDTAKIKLTSERLTACIMSLQPAMEHRDTTLIGDIIIYEFQEMLEELSVQLNYLNARKEPNE